MNYKTATFWSALDDLVRGSDITIDRAKGTAHPRYPALIYPLDYGYLEETTAGDGDGIDVWLGTDTTQAVTAIVCILDPLKRDAEIKLLLGCTDDDTETVHRFLSADAGLPCLVIERPR